MKRGRTSGLIPTVICTPMIWGWRSQVTRGVLQQTNLRLRFFKRRVVSRRRAWHAVVAAYPRENPDVVEIEGYFRDAILSVRGVRELTYLASSYTDAKNREFQIEWRASTDLGELASTERITL